MIPQKSSYVPFYDVKDLERLLKYWRDGSLDGITPDGTAVVGVKDCDRAGHGLRSLAPLLRYTSADVENALGALAAEFPALANLLILFHLKKRPCQDLARVFGHLDTGATMENLCKAQDKFMSILFAG